jgi:hypothetical protein
VNPSALLFLLVFLLTVAVTSTLPALAAAGERSVHSIVELQLTELAAALPNLKVVPLSANPLPVTVTGSPPA